MTERATGLLRTAVDTVRAYLWYGKVLAGGWRRRLGRPSAATGADRPPQLGLFAWLFPPIISGGTYRSAALARYAPEAGWQVTVLAGTPRAEPTDAGTHMERYVSKEIRTARITPPSLLPSFRLFPRVDGGFLTALKTVSVARSLFDDSPPTVVLASGPPFHNFVAAWFIAREYRAKLVLEYRDEWTECPFDFVTIGNVDREWELRCLQSADAVIFVTDTMLDVYRRAFPDVRTDTWTVIPNGWEPEDHAVAATLGAEPGIDSRESRPAGTLVVSFVGFLGDHTLPTGFLRTMSAAVEREPGLADRVTLRFVGRKSPRALEQLQSFAYPRMIELRDQVSRPEAVLLNRTSDALLMINEPSLHRALPGKLYAYLAAQTPVLVYGEGGEIGQLVTHLDAGIVIPMDDPDALAGAIRGLAGRPRSRKNAATSEWLASHTRKQLARRVVDLLDKLCSRH